MSFRLQCKSGKFTLDSLSITSTLSDLQSLIYKKAGIQPRKQKILIGYPPKEISSYNRSIPLASLGMKKGETLILQELETPRNTGSVSEPAEEEVEATPPSSSLPTYNDEVKTQCSNSRFGMGRKLMRRMLVKNWTTKDSLKVVPADNSCLFRSISILLCQDATPTELRELVAGVITSQPEVYSAALLGKDPLDYIGWILKEDSWGGAIELAVFSELFSMEVDVVDIQTNRIDKFGLSNNYPNRALLIYDGIHYDPLVLCDHHGNTVQSVFPVSNDTVLQVALEIATEANKARQFTDVANFSLRCLVCNQPLKGHLDAESHAKSTGHINFGEV